MKNKNIMAAIMIAASIAFGACGGSTPDPSAATEGTTTEQAAIINTTNTYICPMNCEGSGSDQPGKCAVCGMDLVKNVNYKGSGTVVTDSISVKVDSTVTTEGTAK